MEAARTCPDLTFRVDSLADPAKRAAWVDLLRDIFELEFDEFSGLDIWDEGFRAFSWMDGDAIAASVALRPLHLVIGGRRVAAGQIHAVATRPAYRRRGLFRDLMSRALAEADRQFECVLLYSETPQLYESFGFRVIAESRFRGRLELGHTPQRRVRIVELSVRDAQDRAVILRLFAARHPVSDRFGLLGNAGIFVANALAHPGWRLSFLPEEDALIVWERREGATRLHDIAAGRIPSAAGLAAAMELACGPDGRSPELEVLFPPDLLDGTFVPFPHLPEDNDRLCLRGPFAIEGTPLMLPLTAVS
ncbi:MAG: hypothetical protein BroJett029_34400 [Alphaproteobacteria bacterium]|nr:MAG: hypothetical protein BroJett029_34400 [Alphaproteobacteria bacterium]